MKNTEYFPDGMPIDSWFYDCSIPSVETLGKRYKITDYGVKDDGKVYTKEIQALIESISATGGGVLVVPSGTFYTGALFFKRGVHLCVDENGVLKASDDIADFPVCQTRIEGESCLYYPALINADGVDGFTAFGKGVIDGNGERAWKAFWKRREWNPNCTNKDEQRPRLLFLSHCKNATIAQLRLCNSPFWTNHIYKCERVKFLGCSIFAPRAPVPAPSSDAIDVDACKDVLVKDCYMEVNDDGVVLKGGKGPWADESEENGGNERILVEDCRYGFCHSVLTCGSESVHNKNVLVRRIRVENVLQAVHLKMRPDTPQRYEYIRVERLEGSVIGGFLNIHPWTQFFDLKGRTDMPVSTVQNLAFADCVCTCDTFFNVARADGRYRLSDFRFENMKIQAKNEDLAYDVVENIQFINASVETP